MGLRPSAVLRHAKLPSMLYLDQTAVISTMQLFAVWKAIEVLSEDPAFSRHQHREPQACIFGSVVRCQLSRRPRADRPFQANMQPR